MHVELEPAEIETLIEGLDYVKTRISYAKRGSYAEKTEMLLQVDDIEQKLRLAQSADNE
jgi:hypothetical protein